MKNLTPFKHARLRYLYLLSFLVTPLSSASAEDFRDKNNIAMVDKELIVTVTHEAGSSFLSSDDRKKIDEFISRAKARGEIGEVKILSWADREYPAENARVSKDARRLAAKRAEQVKGYLSKTHGVHDLNAFNMAERPNVLEKLFSTEEYEVKTAAENAGMAPTQEQHHVDVSKRRASNSMLVVQLRSPR